MTQFISSVINYNNALIDEVINQAGCLLNNQSKFYIFLLWEGKNRNGKLYSEKLLTLELSYKNYTNMFN